MRWRILLCSDGSPESSACEAVLTSMGFLRDATVAILGVIEPGHEEALLRSGVDQLASRLNQAGIPVDVRIRAGHAAETILDAAETSEFNLIAVGAHGRRGLTRFRLGSTASRVASHVPTSFLACRAIGEAAHPILICTGLEEPSAKTIEVGGDVARSAGAPVTLLHVMSQVALSWESPADDLVASAEAAMARNSREGLLLRRGLETLRRAGVPHEPTARLRHGLVVDEVFEEIRDTNPALLVVGAHRSPETRRSFAPLLDDIAGQLLTNAPCSVLIVRSEPG